MDTYYKILKSKLLFLAFCFFSTNVFSMALQDVADVDNTSQDLLQVEISAHEELLVKIAAIESALALLINNLSGEFESYKSQSTGDLADLKLTISSLSRSVEQLKNELQLQKTTIAAINSALDQRISENQRNAVSLSDKFTTLEGKFNESSSFLASKIDTAEQELLINVERTRRESSESVDELNRVISNNVLYLVIAIASIFITLLLTSFFLRKKIASQETDLTGTLSQTRKSLEEEFVKIDNKLVEIFEAQINVSASSTTAQQNSSSEVDHSLVIKFADEITRIQKNISRMDSSTKGLKQLTASLTRITDNMLANGYEIVDMLGMEYDEGMRVTANFVPDETLKEGERIITRIIKPQINYHGVMIQSADIEVSQGE